MPEARAEAGRLRRQKTWGIRVVEGQEEQRQRGRLGGDAVFHRENAQNTISAENHLEMPHLLSPDCTSDQGFTRNASEQKHQDGG